MKTHIEKVWSLEFSQLRDGKQRFRFATTDAGYALGDTIRFCECTDPNEYEDEDGSKIRSLYGMEPTDRTLEAEVTHMTTRHTRHLKDGSVVISIRVIEPPVRKESHNAE